VTLVERPVRSIVRAVSDAAERWRDADFPPRVRALAAVCARTGYSIPVVEYALDRLFASLTRDAIESVIQSELGSLDVLDGFASQIGRPRSRATPIGTVCVISSRTTIGVAIVPAVFALCAKCNVLVKDRSDALVGAFFATLAEELDELREAATARAWEGTREALDSSAFDAVVAFGDDATLKAIRGQLPAEARWIAYGSKASCGYVARETLADSENARRVADGAARDLVLYDTEGCLSLHVLFVERGGAISPPEFADLLGRAAARASVEFPPSAFDASRAAAVAAARDAAAFRATAGGGASFADAGATYVVTLSDDDRPPEFLPRALPVVPVEAPDAAVRYLTRHRIPIEGIAVSSMRADIAAMTDTLRAARVAEFGTLQSPPLGGYHGGRPRIAEFVRWTSDET
jgi:hypothetical protein